MSQICTRPGSRLDNFTDLTGIEIFCSEPRISHKPCTPAHAIFPSSLAEAPASREHCLEGGFTHKHLVSTLYIYIYICRYIYIYIYM